MPLPITGLEQHYGLDPDEYFSQHDPAAREAGAARIVRDLEVKLGHKGALLDVGSGRGETLKAAAAAGRSVIGVEPSARFAERAADYSGVTDIRRELVDRCDFPCDSFDAVILQTLLEHLYNPDETIRAVVRYLKPGGILICRRAQRGGLVRSGA
jgi:2-polyprenyl-3-methyl-5-hydroxy-6-metoxy-1,4-benzoquinol methylase